MRYFAWLKWTVVLMALVWFYPALGQGEIITHVTPDDSRYQTIVNLKNP